MNPSRKSSWLLATVLLSSAVLLAGAPAAAVPPGVPSGPRLGHVVPVPAVVTASAAGYSITSATTIATEPGSAAVAAVGRYLAGRLRPATGFALPVGEGAQGGIVLRLGGADARVGAEGYQLDVAPAGVTVRAVTPAGLFAAVQTLRQLLPASIEAPRKQPGPWPVPGGRIVDWPRFAHRGAMLDVARHFFGVAEVERYIDEIAQYKINTLHLHLADDQGWRIEIASWPRLASYGGSTEVGGGPGGYYTKADYAAIVAYAASRYITVIPEIDMPGHTNAALASYAELNCNGVAPPLYTGTDVGFSSLCVSKDVTYRFLDDVIRELAAMTPGAYLHIGGDEAQATTPADYRAFMSKVLPIVAKYGKKVSGWHDLLKAEPPASAVGQYWGFGGADASVVAAAKRGNKIIMSPANKAYLDMKYAPNSPWGQDWAGLIEVFDAYQWDPATVVAGLPESSVLGVEAPLWSETFDTMAELEYLAFPRLAAIAELGWSPATTHDWEQFRNRLAMHGPRLTRQAVHFYRSPQVPWYA